MSDSVTAAEWNAAHPIGTAVTYWLGERDGDGLPARTRSEAWELGGEIVVSVEGRPGGGGGGTVAIGHVECAGSLWAPCEPCQAAGRREASVRRLPDGTLAESLDEVLSKADQLMYEAKQVGRNRVVFRL